APLQDSADTDGSIPPTTVPDDAAPRKMPVVAIAGLVGVLLLVGVAMYATNESPSDTALQKPPTPAVAAPAVTAPIVPASVVEPTAGTRAPAAATETVPPKTTRALVRKEPVAAPPPVAPPVEAAPTETIASALFVVEAAEDLQVTCGTRSNSGTTSAKP